MKKEKDFIPQITDVEILDYPVLAGSGNIGIKAKVLGEQRLTTIGLDQEIAWRKASDAEKPVVAMGIAASTFRFVILNKMDMKASAVQSPSELMYHEWERLGRPTEGEEHEFGITDRKLFGHKDEAEISFDVHDGFAVGELEDKEYVMFYPTMHQVSYSETKKQKIEFYVGQPVIDTGICPHDIALTYSEIKFVNKIEKELEWDADKTIRQNAMIKPDMFNAILKDAGIENDLKLPTLKNGCVKAGYIVLNDDNRVAEFREIPKLIDVDKNTAFLKNMPPENSMKDMLGMYVAWKEKVNRERVTDVTFRCAPNDPKRWFIGCKIDGEQQVSRQLTQRDANLYRQLDDKNSSYGKQLVDGFVANYFREALTKTQNIAQGMKR